MSEKKNSLQSVRYSRGKLSVLDQLLLPTKSEYIELVGHEDAWTVIRTMQVRGAPLIAIVAALGLAIDSNNYLTKDEFSFYQNNVVKVIKKLIKSMIYLRTSRPTAVNLFNAMDELTTFLKNYLLKNYPSISLDFSTITSQTSDNDSNDDIYNDEGAGSKLLLSFIEYCESLLHEDVATNELIGMNGALKILDLLPNRKKIRILTICNTGSLATAGFGTALGVIRALTALDRLEIAYALETRPYNQGARLTAYELVEDKIPNATLITDSMAAALMAVKGIDVVVVGADRIAGNGDFANKIGTYNVMIAAKYHKVLTFTAAPSTTVDLAMASGSEIEVEERPGDELTCMFGQRIAPEGIKVWNPSFDVTPCSLLTGIITELGVISPTLPATVTQTEDSGISKNADPIFQVSEYFRAQTENFSSLTDNEKNLLDIMTKNLSTHHYDDEESTNLSDDAKKQKAFEIRNRVLLKMKEKVHSRISNDKLASPIVVPVAYKRMTPDELETYIKKDDYLSEILKLSEKDRTSSKNSPDYFKLELIEVGDGNLNFVYIVSGRENIQIVIKQALPFVRCFGEDWPLTLDRAMYENEALREHQALAGKHLVPTVYNFDKQNAIIAMEYILPPSIILRKHLINGTKLPKIATDLGNYMAKTLFHTSALALSASNLRQKQQFWNGNVSLCALTEKVVFIDPYTNCPSNRWTPSLQSFVKSISSDNDLKLASSYFKSIYVGKQEALLHGDLHTGSIMASENETKVIDPEFAFYGPIGFDVAALLGNYYFSFFAHAANESNDYKDYILEQIEVIFNTFTATFKELWLNHTKNGELYPSSMFNESTSSLASYQNYIDSIFLDTIAFISMELIRRTIGIAHVADIDEGIVDEELRGKTQKKILLFARHLAINAHKAYTSDSNILPKDIPGLNTLAKSFFNNSEIFEWPN